MQVKIKIKVRFKSGTTLLLVSGAFIIIAFCFGFPKKLQAATFNADSIFTAVNEQRDLNGLSTLKKKLFSDDRGASSGPRCGRKKLFFPPITRRN